MTRATGITFTLTLLLGCGPGGGPHSAVAPDPLSASTRDRHASQDACPEHGEISFTRVANDGSELTLELHCGGWLDRCDEYFDKVDDPEGPHLEVVEGYPGHGAEDYLHGEFHPIEASSGPRSLARGSGGQLAQLEVLRGRRRRGPELVRLGR